MVLHDGKNLLLYRPKLGGEV
eukprot:COSAG01_NODE_32530_length_579_cov_1.793750_1_plen_20_part_10